MSCKVGGFDDEEADEEESDDAACVLFADAPDKAAVWLAAPALVVPYADC
jgi:hypothetical protein